MSNYLELCKTITMLNKAIYAVELTGSEFTINPSTDVGFDYATDENISVSDYIEDKDNIVFYKNPQLHCSWGFFN